jgi:hypothetical protein
MVQQQVLSKVHSAAWEARDRYRWLLLTGWFVLSATVLSLVVAMPTRVSTASLTLIAIAAVALVSYNVAIKRYWVVAIAALAMMIVATGWIVR